MDKTYHKLEKLSRNLPPQAKEFLEWIRNKPCLICGNGTYHDDVGAWLSDPHHVLARGMGGGSSKHVGNVVPLCRRHHVLIHTIGFYKFEDKYNIRLNSKAKEYESRWKKKRALEREE